MRNDPSPLEPGRPHAGHPAPHGPMNADPRTSPVTFFICGAPKAGTTSLYHYLSAHPDVCMTVPKETGFFTKNSARGIDRFFDDYLPHYAGETAIGEASAGTLHHRHAAGIIRDHFPAAKMIACLRDPVDRIYSHFLFDMNLGKRPPGASFSEAIRDEGSRWRNTMVGLGMYHDQLQNLRAHFPDDQIKVLEFRDFRAHTAERVAELFEFLGLPAFDAVDTEARHNETSYVGRPGLYRAVYRATRPLKALLPFDNNRSLFRLKSAVRNLFFTAERPAAERSPEDVAYLAEIYREPNRRLAGAVDLDLSHWT